ncbi:MAG TPA: replication-associated recombination protein A [Polyangia bacterium]|nr:replication-associated recombination protein A [Polyangia bacterium]
MDLFAAAASKDRRGQPLAERMRPRTLAELVGQGHLLGPGKLLRRALESKDLPSIILWGPPGTGKTTLGRLLAAEAHARFVPLSAVMAGVKELREAVAEAATRRDQQGERTVLFVDEIHRFNKGQQDALLPHVEAGTVVLVGATTENPSFEVNAALLSRAKVVVLQALSDADLRTLVDRALADKERGLGGRDLVVADEVRDLIVREARGDARRALATLEAAAAVAAPDAAGRATITVPVVEEAAQKKTLLYDKAGDEHYGVVSAFIKSLRGSDPDAAVYWMARMLEAGEDPLFVLRRLVIFAAEDIGVADARALSVATAALDAFRFVGLPEGILPMTEAAIYLATAPKSNTALTTYAAAKADVDAHGALPVPAHLRNASSGMAKALGWGAAYRYPHDFAGHHVREEYLPEALRGQRYYQPSDSGDEREIAARQARLAEAAKTSGEKK